MSGGIDLKTKNPADKIALRGVRVRSRLSGMSQTTTVEQTFINAEHKAIEAIYTFPLPENAAVCAFEVITGDRVLTGKIEEREKAIEVYESSINKGDAAFLLERERPDIFTVRVGNLNPGQAATVSLTYVSELEVVDRSIRLAFPTTVAPRFVTATASDPLEMMIDGDAINPPRALEVPYGLTMSVEIDLGRALKSIASPSHSIKTEFAEGHRYTMSFASGVSEMNRDVILNLELSGEQQPCAQVSTGPDGAKYVAVTFLPQLDEESLVKRDFAEVVFVIDCSGSMQGPSIAQAKSALELCLRSMSLGDRFNICRFGSTFELMSAHPIVYSEASLRDALDYVAELKADLGGTEIYAPLEAIFQVPPQQSARQMIVLTDGQISNEDAVMKLVAKHRAKNRIFSFGIGSAPSQHLVRGLARASRGACEFISENENIADKVLRTFSRIASPVITDVELDWAGSEAAAAPADVPPIFDGDALTVMARVEGKLPTQVTLKANTAFGARSWSVKLRDIAGAQGIATTWARRMIQSLEESDPALPERRARLIRISRDFNLLCSLAAFVAVEHRSVEERNDGRPALRRVPVQLAKGWGGMDSPRVLLAGAVMKAARHSFGPPVSREVAFCLKQVDSAPHRDETSLVHDPLHNLLGLQTAPGGFNWNGAGADSVDSGIGIDSYRKKLSKEISLILPGDLKASRKMLEDTLITLIVLQTLYDERRKIWQRAYIKAIGYLAGHLNKQPAEVEAWVGRAILSLKTVRAKENPP